VAADLAPLEQAAAGVGLPFLKARVVHHDPRRGWWFWWGDGELLVSDRVIQRCSPADAGALLIDDVLRRREVRRRTGALQGIAAFTVAGMLVAFVHDSLFWHISFPSDAQLAAGVGDGPVPWVAVVPLLMLIVLLTVAIATLVSMSARTAEHADDETVNILGGAALLIRGLDAMALDESRGGGSVLNWHSRLHQRAERLRAKHRLCDAQPE
jgi:hypothetical protein